MIGNVEVSQVSQSLFHSQEGSRWVTVARADVSEVVTVAYGDTEQLLFASERLSRKIEGFKHMTFCRNSFNNSLCCCVDCSCRYNNEFHFENAN